MVNLFFEKDPTKNGLHFDRLFTLGKRFQFLSLGIINGLLDQISTHCLKWIGWNYCEDSRRILKIMKLE